LRIYLAAQSVFYKLKFTLTQNETQPVCGSLGFRWPTLVCFVQEFYLLSFAWFESLTYFFVCYPGVWPTLLCVVQKFDLLYFVFLSRSLTYFILYCYPGVWPTLLFPEQCSYLLQSRQDGCWGEGRKQSQGRYQLHNTWDMKQTLVFWTKL